MIPSPFAFVLLALGAFRVLRLVSWDEWPPVAKLRARVLGEEWVRPAGSVEPDPPGKTPATIVPELVVTYRRPLLAHLVHCPFCMGWWVSLAVACAWWVTPHWTLVALLPFALSAVVGLGAKNLDP